MCVFVCLSAWLYIKFLSSVLFGNHLPKPVIFIGLYVLLVAVAWYSSGGVRSLLPVLCMTSLTAARVRDASAAWIGCVILS